MEKRNETAGERDCEMSKEREEEEFGVECEKKKRIERKESFRFGNERRRILASKKSLIRCSRQRNPSFSQKNRRRRRRKKKKWIAAEGGGAREGIANRGVEEGRRNRFGERIKNCSSLRTWKNRGRSGGKKEKREE